MNPSISCSLALLVLGLASSSPAQLAKPPASVPEANQAVSLESVLAILAARGGDAANPHPVATVDIPKLTSCGPLTTDAQSAFLHAVAYARSTEADRARFAKIAAAILQAWASTNHTFTGGNGSLCAAWNIGSMSRTAYLLKSLKAPEYAAIADTFEPWAVHAAQAYLLPIDDRHPLKGTEPALLNDWELRHVTNRSLASLEAVLHVSRLVGNKRWYRSAVERYEKWIRWKDFKAPNGEPDEGTTYFVNLQGENTDHHRGDIWHRTAGLASCLQICAVVKADTGYDLFHRERDVLRNSLEFYAAIHEKEGGLPIPVWDLAARAFPESQAIQGMAVRQKALEQPKDPDRYLQYAWGFSDLLSLRPKN